jgi:hypothetical protein
VATRKRVPAPNRRGRGIEAQEALVERPKVEKVTLYVRPDQVLAVEEIQLEQRRRTGKRPDKSDLVQEALDLLIQKYSNTE